MPTSNRPLADRLRQVTADPRWILLPLRGYLAFTFLYAGLSKIGGHSFLDPNSPMSIHATLVAVKAQSPIGGLLGPVESHSFAFGVLMAIGETAVGVGVLFGLFNRIAALGGMLISLSLFLTVSWGATPWYTGADIVYLFAFTPLLLGGAGLLSADGWLAAARERDRGADPVVSDRTRRTLLAGVVGIVGLIAFGSAAIVRRASKSSDTEAGAQIDADPPTASASTAAVEPSAAPSSPAAGSSGPAGSSSPAASPSVAGRAIVAASEVPVGGAKKTTDPSTGDEIYVLQLESGKYTALDSTCPHQGCAVSFVSKSSGFACPCHGSRFTATGALINGPATTGLSAVPVALSGSEIVRT